MSHGMKSTVFTLHAFNNLLSAQLGFRLRKGLYAVGKFVRGNRGIIGIAVPLKSISVAILIRDVWASPGYTNQPETGNTP